MAEAALLAILTGFVANVASEPLKKIRLPLWFETELRKLEDTISLIERVVLDAEKKQDTNDQARVWLDSLEDIILDVDNLVNKVFYKKLQDEAVPGKIKAKVRNLNPHFRWKISNKITQIRETLADIKGNRDFLLRLGRLEVGGVSASTEGWGETDSYLSSDQVIGRFADRDDVLRHLLDNNIEGGEKVSVVSIVGFGGLGKTTLAKFVFNDTRVKQYFDNNTYWVSVSIFDLKLLLQKIIRSVTGKSPEPNLDNEQLQNHLRREIQAKKYLLVLDNVWNEDSGQWGLLKTFLNVGAEGSKVLITTRSEIVAQMTTHSTRIHSLGRLDENRSWALFEREAFVQQSYEPTVYPRLVKIGKEIVAKCQGVPLAIKAIGTLLKSKQYTSQNLESEWKSFRDTKLAEVDFEDQSENMMAILKLSYNNLQPDLKHCFSYCSLFPKDHEINVGQLIKLWIAQGFIIPNSNSTQLEEIGYKNFMILFRRYFFQQVETDELPSRSIRSCKMHHFMHDLACSVAGKSTNILDENLVDQYTSSIRLGRNARNAFKRVRHIYVEFKSDNSFRISTLFNEKRVRTFIIPQSKNLSSSHYDEILSKFKYLRALSLRIERDVATLPNKFGRLKYLRYLDLSHNRYIKELPRSITELYYLQTLILCFCTSLVSLPTDIQNLISLRHLEIDGCLQLTHMPRGIGQLVSLQTLDMFIVAENNLNERGGFGELSRLKNLRGHLTIQILGLGESGDAQFLNDMEHLESLTLNWEIRGVANAEAALKSLEPRKDIKAIQVWNYPGETFPDWFCLLTSLVRLELSFCTKLKYLPPLHQLSSLQELKLEFLSALEYVSDRDHLSSSTMSFFQSLTTLKIMECPILHGWWGRGGQTLTGHQPQQQQQQQQPPFPVLSELEISNCPVLNSEPLFPNLESLELDRTSFKPLELKIMSVAASSSSSYSLNLSKLKVLTVHNLEHLEPQLLDALTNSLPSLQSLRI